MIEGKEILKRLKKAKGQERIEGELGVLYVQFTNRDERFIFTPKEFLEFLDILLSVSSDYPSSSSHVQYILLNINKSEILPQESRGFLGLRRRRVLPDIDKSTKLVENFIDRILQKNDISNQIGLSEKLAILDFLIANQEVLGLEENSLQHILSQVIERQSKELTAQDYLTKYRQIFDIISICDMREISLPAQINLFSLLLLRSYEFQRSKELFLRQFQFASSLNAESAIKFLQQIARLELQSSEFGDASNSHVFITNLLSIFNDGVAITIDKMQGGSKESLDSVYFLFSEFAKRAANFRDSHLSKSYLDDFKMVLKLIANFSSNDLQDEFLIKLKENREIAENIAVQILKEGCYQENDFIIRAALVCLEGVIDLDEFVNFLAARRIHITSSSQLSEFLERFSNEEILNKISSFTKGFLPIESLLRKNGFVEDFCARYIKSPVNLQYLNLLQRIVVQDPSFKSMAFNALKSALNFSLRFEGGGYYSCIKGVYIVGNAEEVAEIFSRFSEHESIFKLCVSQVIDLKFLSPEQLKETYSRQNLQLYFREASDKSLDVFLNYLALDGVDVRDFLSLVLDLTNHTILEDSNNFLVSLLADEKLLPCIDILAQKFGEDNLFLALRNSERIAQSDLIAFVKSRVVGGNISVKQLEFLFTKCDLSVEERAVFTKIIADKIDKAIEDGEVNDFVVIRNCVRNINRADGVMGKVLKRELLELLSPTTLALLEVMPQSFFEEIGYLADDVSIQAKLQGLPDEELNKILEICYLSPPKRFSELFERQRLSFADVIRALDQLGKRELMLNFVLANSERNPQACVKFAIEVSFVIPETNLLDEISKQYDIDFLYRLYNDARFIGNNLETRHKIADILSAKIAHIESYSNLEEIEKLSQVLNQIATQNPELFLKINLTNIIEGEDDLSNFLIEKLSPVAKFQALKSCQHKKLLEAVEKSIQDYGLTYLLDRVLSVERLPLELLAEIVQVLQKNNKLKFDVAAEPELASLLRSIKLRDGHRDKLTFCQIMQSLILANDDKSGAGSLLLRPKIEVSGILCEKVKDVALLAILLPEMLRPSHYQILAQNEAFIKIINATLEYPDSTYFNRASLQLFNGINRYIPERQERINVDQLISFEELVVSKKSLPRQTAVVMPEVGSLVCYKLIAANSEITFDDFYANLGQDERDSLSLGGDNLAIQLNWRKLMSNSDLIIEYASYAKTREEFTSMLASAMQLTTQAECAINLRTQLQGDLETKRYANLEDAAFAVACFYSSYQAFNSLGGDIIHTHRNYEEILKGNKNIYLSQRSFFKLIGEKYVEFLEKSDKATDFLMEGAPEDDEASDYYERVAAVRVENLIKRGGEIYARISAQAQECQPALSPAASAAQNVVGIAPEQALSA